MTGESRPQPLLSEILIDSSAVIAVLMREPAAASVAELMLKHRLVTPASIDFEIGNSLSAMFKRKRIDLDDALVVAAAFQRLTIRRVAINLLESVEIAAKLNLYAYDACLVQCAAGYGLPLLTLDGGLIRGALSWGVDVVEVMR